MRFIDSRSDFPVSNAVIYSGHVFQAVLTGIPKGETKPVPGGAATEMREIFRQLDRTLSEVGIDKTQIVSVKLYLQDLSRDLKAWTESMPSILALTLPIAASMESTCSRVP
jgi:enamine deaminase RidA (YjgF/YER057c/UK114 family)